MARKGAIQTIITGASTFLSEPPINYDLVPDILQLSKYELKSLLYMAEIVTYFLLISEITVRN